MMMCNVLFDDQFESQLKEKDVEHVRIFISIKLCASGHILQFDPVKLADLSLKNRPLLSY
jgi:hypothetical protein